MNHRRRRSLIALLLCGTIASHATLAQAAAGDRLPPELAALVPPGAKLKDVDDPANTADKTYATAGTLPAGNNQVVALVGTKRFQYDMNVGAERDKAAAQRLFKHYDTEVAKAGGKRLNQGFDTESWIGTYAKLHVYELPTANGPIQFGLWIQDQGEHHWLMLFPAADTRKPATASDLESRIANFGSAPLYINFDTNKAELKADGLTAVAQMVALLEKNPGLKLSVEGHTDNVGTAEANKALSLARANAVVAAVVAKGIAGGRLATVGRGQERPIADNRTESGRATNRRVELVQIK